MIDVHEVVISIKISFDTQLKHKTYYMSIFLDDLLFYKHFFINLNPFFDEHTLKIESETTILMI